MPDSAAEKRHVAEFAERRVEIERIALETFTRGKRFAKQPAEAVVVFDADDALGRDAGARSAPP